MDTAAQRRKMVERQLAARSISDTRVLTAMLEIPREIFVPEHLHQLAYEDEPVPIGFGQSISQPYMVALMAQSLELTGTELVLDVGAGSGYHAAVLGALAARVIAIELIPQVAAMAQRNLEEAGCAANITVICADGSKGYPEAAPFDAISVAAAASYIPAALLEQLNDPGRLVIPIGAGLDQELLVVRKQGGEIRTNIVAYCRFVPLREGNEKS